MNDVVDIRAQLVKWGRRLVEKGLVVAAGGNISARVGDTMFISPSGYSISEATEEDYVPVEISTGKILDDFPIKPSSEVLMHLRCYRVRPDIRAIVHVHPPLLVGVISAGEMVVPFTPDAVALLGKPAIIEYILPTTDELAKAVEEKVKNADVIFLRNHGVVTVGANLREACYKAEVAEDTAKSFLAAKISGILRLFSEDELEAIKGLSSEQYRLEIMRKMQET